MTVVNTQCNLGSNRSQHDFRVSNVRSERRATVSRASECKPTSPRPRDLRGRGEGTDQGLCPVRSVTDLVRHHLLFFKFTAKIGKQ